MSCLVRSSPTTLGNVPVQSPYGAARGAGLGQVPAERSLDASVRSRRSGRSTPRSGTPTARVMSCLGPAPVSVAVRRRSRGGPRSGTPRYPSSVRSVRFGSVRFRAPATTAPIRMRFLQTLDGGPLVRRPMDRSMNQRVKCPKTAKREHTACGPWTGQPISGQCSVHGAAPSYGERHVRREIESKKWSRDIFAPIRRGVKVGQVAHGRD